MHEDIIIKTAEFFTEMSLLSYFVVVLNLFLVLVSKPLLRFLNHGKPDAPLFKTKLRVFSAINVFFIGLVFYLEWSPEYTSSTWVTKCISVVVIVYLSHLVTVVYQFWIRNKFAIIKETDDQITVRDTYRSRVWSIIGTIFIYLISLVAIIQALEFENLLQAGGVLGLIGVMLALTQASWAPDIISGLIILNSGFTNEDDVIQIKGPGFDMLVLVYKVKMFHTELLNLTNNHRVMIKNSKIRDLECHNLSRFASAKGLRECLTFNIGYDTTPTTAISFFESVFAELQNNSDIKIEHQHPVEVRVLDTGNDAVRWGVFYYTKDVKQILKTRHTLNEILLRRSLEERIDLSTPKLMKVDAEISQTTG